MLNHGHVRVSQHAVLLSHFRRAHVCVCGVSVIDPQLAASSVHIYLVMYMDHSGPVLGLLPMHTCSPCSLVHTPRTPPERGVYVMCVHAKIIATYHDAFYSKPHAARTLVCSHTQETQPPRETGDVYCGVRFRALVLCVLPRALCVMGVRVACVYRDGCVCVSVFVTRIYSTSQFT